MGHVFCILLLKYRKYSMYFEKKKYFKYFHTHVFQNTILNTFESQYFKKYFKYFSHSIFPQHWLLHTHAHPSPLDNKSHLAYWRRRRDNQSQRVTTKPNRHKTR